MKRTDININPIVKVLIIVPICFFVIAVSTTVAQSGGPYRIVWNSIDGGSGISSSGSYTLTGTVGQPDAGYHYEAPYELLGGFWVGGPLCIVNLEHFAQFAAYWLDGPCNETNNWCGGADLNQMDDVNIDDLSILANRWLDICPFGWPLK